MKIAVEDICQYLDFLIGKQSLYITLHGSFVTIPELIRYNFHLNPYCAYIKTACKNWDLCVKKQSRITLKCSEGEFFGVCHAGVGEYVYPVCYEEAVMGFISVSGYKGQDESTAKSKALHFAEKNSISKECLLQMRDCALISEIPPKSELDALIHPLVFMLERYLEEEKKYSEKEDLYSNLVRYITSNHTCRLTMKELSQRFNYSVSTLSHLFKKRSGVSINDYIENLRIDEAKWLLKHSAYSITEISVNLGFCNPAYFSSVFKKKIGVSPKDFSHNKFK